MTKLLKSGSLPSFKDGSLAFMMVIHLFTFLILHSNAGNRFLKSYKYNYAMRIVHNSAKGLGNSYRMISLIVEGLEKRINPYYFMFIIASRSMASRLLKEVSLKLCINRKVDIRELEFNLYEMGIPTILLYLSIQTDLVMIHSYLQMSQFSQYFTSLFTAYMVVWGIVKSLLKI